MAHIPSCIYCPYALPLTGFPWCSVCGIQPEPLNARNDSARSVYMQIQANLSQLKNPELRTIGQKEYKEKAEEAYMVIEYHALLNIQATLSGQLDRTLSPSTVAQHFNKRLEDVNNIFDAWYKLKTSNYGKCSN